MTFSSPGVSAQSRGRARRVSKRARRHARAVQLRHHITADISSETYSFDPLSHSHAGRGWRTVVAVLLGLAAAALHVAVLVLLFGVSSVFDEGAEESDDGRIKVTMVEPEPVAEQESAPEPEPEPEATESAPPPPDPVDVPTQAVPESPTNSPRPRRIVGLSLESTVTGGGGAAFAVGNTRMGKTQKIAADPELMEDKVNRVATRIPRKGVKITRPKLKGDPVEALYPELLKAQGIEGDVVVVVVIGIDGTVKDVKIIKASNHAAFNEAAVAAAWKRVFEPATRDGVPISTTQKFTIKFRLKDE